MKRVKFKNKFNNIDEALTKVPDVLKENNNVFEMTDGNQTIKVRWEGSLTEGTAVALISNNKSLINEDINYIKHLMGYKTSNKIGTHNGEGRLMENKKFIDMMNNVKTLNEEAINEALLEEGILNVAKKLAIVLGMSLASFNAMAQENPKQAVDTVKQEVSKLTPQQMNDIRKSIGLELSDEYLNKYFEYAPQKEFKGAPAAKLSLGKFAGRDVAKIVNVATDNNGGHIYTVEVGGMYETGGNFNELRNYIAQQNSNLKNSTIKFVNSKGYEYGGKSISL